MPGVIEDPNKTWKFVYDPHQVPDTSSPIKACYTGTFIGGPQRRPIPAIALAFEEDSVVAFGTECANLSRLGSMGVGPRLYAVARHCFGNPQAKHPTIIEEIVGTKLADLLGSGKQATSEHPVIHPAGSPERKQENMKILYDVFVQLSNAH